MARVRSLAVWASFVLALSGCSGGGGGSGSASAPAAADRQTHSGTVAVNAGASRRSETAVRYAKACTDARLPVRRAQFESRFFPHSLRGLWARPGGHCLYIIEPGQDRPKPVWSLKEDEQLRGFQWAPDGGSFAATVKQLGDGSWVYVVARDGRLLTRHSARGGAFLRDGRLVLQRQNGLYLLGGESLRRIATASQLQERAGFPAGSATIGEGVRTNGSGYGDSWVAVRWESGSLKRGALLVVSTSGQVRRASPFYGASSRLAYNVGGLAWSPDGRELFEMPSAPWPGEGLAVHDHCLDSWTPRRGFRRLWCISELPRRFRFHFDRLAWSRTGAGALLNNGTIVARSGRVSGRLPGYRVGSGATGYNGAFLIHWSRS